MTATVADQISQTPGIARPDAPQALPGEFFLRDGTPAMIWPLLPMDAQTLRDGFRRLSPDSRRRRFLGVLDQLDDAMIRRLVDSVDGVHHMALVLIVLPPEGKEEPAGIARLVQYPDDPASADIAVTVVDDWQRRGAGTALVSALMQRRPVAVTRLRALVGADNRPSLALLAGTGRISSGLPERGVLDVTVELPAASQAGSAAEKAARFWALGARKLAGQTYLFPGPPQAGLALAVEQYFAFVQRMLEMNRHLTARWLQVACAQSGVTCHQVRVSGPQESRRTGRLADPRDVAPPSTGSAALAAEGPR